MHETEFDVYIVGGKAKNRELALKLEETAASIRERLQWPTSDQSVRHVITAGGGAKPPTVNVAYWTRRACSCAPRKRYAFAVSLGAARRSDRRHASGVDAAGAHRFRDLFRSVLQVELQPFKELQAVVRGLTFLSDRGPADELFTIDVGRSGIQPRARWICALQRRVS